MIKLWIPIVVFPVKYTFKRVLKETYFQKSTFSSLIHIVYGFQFSLLYRDHHVCETLKVENVKESW